jgi:hypothetical protein
VASEIRWTVLLAALVVLLPMSVDVRIASEDGTTQGLRLPLVDGLLLGLLALLAIEGSLKRGARVLLSSPALLTVVGLSLLATLSRLGDGGSWTEALQRFDTFAVAYVVGRLAPRPALARALGPALAGATALFLALAVFQWLGGEPPVRIRGPFENRHLFGGWVAIALALVVARAPFASWKGWGLAVLLALAALGTATTALPLIGLVIGGTVAACRAAGRRGLGLSLVGTVVLVGLFAALAARAHVARTADDWRLTDEPTLEALHARGKEIDAHRYARAIGETSVAGRRLQLRLANWQPVVDPPDEPRRTARFEPGYVRQRWLEWQAAAFAVAEEPLLGGGLGSYQSRTSRNYRTFKKLMTLEPDSQSGYVVELVSHGIAGLVALVGFLVFYLRRSARLAHGPALAAFATAAALGLAIPLFTNFLVVPLVFLAAAVDREASKNV